MALNDPFELDPTSATSNSNVQGANIAENCAPSGINNAIRALGSMLALATSYQSAAISSSVSTNIAATGSGFYQAITGANAINSFGTVPGAQPSAAVFRILEFSSSASISHGAKIALPGSRAIRTQPGDILGVVHEGSSDVWRAWLYSPADGGLAGQSISISLINATAINAISLSVSVINVVGVQEFPRACFFAHKNGTDQTSVSNTASVSFGTETFDVGSFFNGFSYIPSAGFYRLTVQTRLNLTTAGASAPPITTYLNKNGSIIAQAMDRMDTSINSITQNLTAIVQANGTDAFTVTVDNGGAAAAVVSVLGGSSQSFFCGERI